MDFTRRKPSRDSMDRLYRIKIDTVKPFALMLAPVYLWLGANEKFISVKAPLDFFTADELNRLKGFQYFYLPESAGSVLPFRQAAHQVRALLRIKPKRPMALTSQAQFPSVPLSPAPYEVSNEVLKLIGPLWWEFSEEITGIEPFLVTAFTNELCELIPEAKLFAARELDTRKYDWALLCSSWTVFLALHLGYCDYAYLNSLRLKAFDQTLDGVALGGGDDLIQLAYEVLRQNPKQITNEDFSKRGDLLSQKISSRLIRISRELVGKGDAPPTVYGEGGFIDA